MRLSPKAIKDFQEKFLKARGIELTDDQANEMGIRLLELTNLTLQANNKVKPP